VHTVPYLALINSVHFLCRFVLAVSISEFRSRECHYYVAKCYIDSSHITGSVGVAHIQNST
jgi:hypothetical protein